MNYEKELDDVSKKLVKMEALLAKAEEDGVYDDHLYKEIDKLENRRLKLEKQIEQMESESYAAFNEDSE